MIHAKMNKKRSFEIFLTVIIGAIFVSQVIAFSFFLYWEFWWFDIIMHFIGGIFIGLLSLYIYYYSDYIEPKHFSFLVSLFIVFGAVSFIGVLWELFEFASDQFAISIGKRVALQQEFRDTLGDLFFDIVGGIFAAFIYIYLWKKN